MRKVLLGLALLTTVTTITLAADVRKERKVKKTKSATCGKGRHACGLKKVRA